MCRIAKGLPPLCLFPCIAVAAWLLLAACPPVAANVAPDAALLIHVQAVGGDCETVVDCHDVMNRTEQLGQVEFLLLLYPRSWQSEPEPMQLYQLHCDLVWPESWDFVNGWFCSGWGSLDYSGTGTHALDMQWWPCADLPNTWDAVFPVARLIFNADVPGRLGAESYWNGATVKLGCLPTPFTVSAAVCHAEVGFECEYEEFTCGYSGACGAGYSESQLELIAPLGGSAQAETELSIGDLCGWFSVETLADWLEVSVTGIEPYHYRLLVTADATDLPVGEYSTWIRTLLPRRGRCLPVFFTVEDATASARMSWGRIKALYP